MRVAAAKASATAPRVLKQVAAKDILRQSVVMTNEKFVPVFLKLFFRLDIDDVHFSKFECWILFPILKH